jgi:hypothetical protein
MPRPTPWLRCRTGAGFSLGIILVLAGAARASDQPAGGPSKVAGTPALTLADIASHPLSPTALYLETGVIDTGTPVKGLERHAGAKSAGARFVIQLDGPMTPDRAGALRDAGVVLGDYLPMNAWIARLDRADPAKVAALGFVRWHAEFDPVWKLSPGLGRRNFSQPARLDLAGQGLCAVVVTLFDGEPADALVADLANLPGPAPGGAGGPGGGANAPRVLWSEDWAGHATLCLVLPVDNVAFLALRPDVQFVEEAPDLELRNSTVRWIVQTNQVNNTKFWDNGVTGTGQVVGVLDGEIDRNHCSFLDTQPIGPLHRKILAYNAPAGTDFHGTHVACTAVGDSGDMSDKRGVAYNGKLVYNVIPSFNEGSVVAALDLHHAQGARVHTNSWGNDGTTQYDSMCRGFDLFNWNHEDSLVVLAVTNQSLLKNPENAKNLLAIGNSQDTPTQANHCTGGDGPTSDGRRKPEVYAPGCGTISASAGTPCGTASATGTSMATPAVAGLALLMRQYFVDGYYPDGVAGTGESILPSAALLKSLLVNGAVDMTGVAGFPSNREGWGRVLGDNAIYFPGDTRTLIFGDTPRASGFTTGQSFETGVNVLSTAEPFKVTLVWTEPPAAAGASFAPVNNLDLTVTSPSGDVYKGNIFSGGQSATGGSYDDRNNVEQVLVSAPAPGAWTITVNAVGVNVGPQSYAWCATGDVFAGPSPISISVANPPPALRPPGEFYMVHAAVRPGDDTMVEGSATLHVRAAPDRPFADIPLVPAGGADWQGTLPRSSCGDTPQFYVSVEGVASGVRTNPPGAPANTYSSNIGALDSAVVAVGDFTAGLPAGWTATGLWNWTSTACPAGDPCAPGGWAYYGRADTCTFDNGALNEGLLTAPPFVVPSGDTVTLSYCSSLVTENNPSYDIAELLINGAVVQRADESVDWQTRTLDLAAYRGSTVTFAWRFRTVDDVQNGFRGWQVSNVRVTAVTTTCVNPCLADWDHNGVVNSTDVSDFINDWFLDQQAGTLTTDFDGNGVVNSTDVSAFINAYFEASPVCAG